MTSLKFNNFPSYGHLYLDRIFLNHHVKSFLDISTVVVNSAPSTDGVS